MDVEPLRIAQVAPLWTAVPPVGYGGAELMVSWLTEALVHQGHDVTLFASGESVTTGRLHPTQDVCLITAMEDGTANQYEAYAVSAITNAVAQSSSFDVIHSHVGPLGIPFSRLSPIPVVHTVHQALDGVDEQWLLRQYPEARIASISDSQVAEIPEQRRQQITTVYHGCDFGDYEFGGTGGSYLAFLSRMGQNKNPAGAIRIAKEVGMPIVLAGAPQDPSESKYFDREVRPLIDGSSVTYLGAISQQEKVRLLRDAAALLFPIRWEEHFGIAMIEAMACGTPVVANRRGSVPEVVDSGITGFYSSDESELAKLVRMAIGLDRRRVYEHAKRRFGHDRMAEAYLRLYRDVIAQQCGGPSK